MSAFLRIDVLERLADAWEGIPILGTMPGSPAAEAGLRYADILIAVNGAAVSNMDEYFAARRSIRPGDQIELVVVRGAEFVTLSFIVDPLTCNPEGTEAGY